MKLAVIANKDRFERYQPDLPIVGEVEQAVFENGTPDEGVLASAADADFLMVDAITPVSARLIEGMPNLKLVHSEGVAFNAIDCEAAAARGIYVCNNRGMNAIAVAEQSMLLMLGLVKHVREGDAAVRTGRQIEVKERLMVSGIEELYGATLGLVGFGAIAREVAVRAHAFGMEVFYNKRHPLSAEDEAAYHASFLPLDDLLAKSHFVSVHVPVTDATRGMVDEAFLAKMCDGSYLVNTARGEIVDGPAVVRALESGKLAGAAFDTIAPEPVTADNPLVSLPPELECRVLYSPHIGGVTANMFFRSHRHIWENIARVAAGERPDDVVNGV